jgi:hypothetical protein
MARVHEREVFGVGVTCDIGIRKLDSPRKGQSISYSHYVAEQGISDVCQCAVGVPRGKMSKIEEVFFGSA